MGAFRRPAPGPPPAAEPEIVPVLPVATEPGTVTLDLM